MIYSQNEVWREAQLHRDQHPDLPLSIIQPTCIGNLNGVHRDQMFSLLGAYPSLTEKLISIDSKQIQIKNSQDFTNQFPALVKRLRYDQLVALLTTLLLVNPDQAPLQRPLKEIEKLMQAQNPQSSSLKLSDLQLHMLFYRASNLFSHRLLIKMMATASQSEMYGIDTNTISDMTLFSNLVDEKKYHKFPKVKQQFFSDLTLFLHHNHSSLLRQISRIESQKLILGFSFASMGSDDTWRCLL